MSLRTFESPTRRTRDARNTRTNDGLVDDPRWHLAQRIAGSRSIGRSPLLSDFLLYVCDRHLRDKSSDLTEQRIGVKVFGRVEGYNSNDDNIVRNYARTLRKRVNDYFETEGRHEDLTLEIPRGGYTPVFTWRHLESASHKPPSLQISEPDLPAPHAFAPPDTVEAATEEFVSPLLPSAESVPVPPAFPTESPIPSQPLPAAKSFASAILWTGIGLALLGIALAAFAWHTLRTGSRSPLRATSTDVLWSQLFQPDRDTFIVPADSGLVILQGLTQQPVGLNEYVAGSYHTIAASQAGLTPNAVNDLGSRRYTSIVDLDLVSHLSRLPQVVPERMLIRYARDLRMDDLRSGNAILLGSVDSNPWEELFEQQVNFRFSFSPTSDSSPTILNVHPKPGEQAVYANHHSGQWHNTFALIAYLPNLDGTGHVLMVGGLNMAGTQAAGDFLLNPDLMKPTLEHARAANGTLRPFELLIETDNVAANASRPFVVSERIGSP